MKCCLFLTVAVLSAVLVDGLPLLKKYSTRLQQEEFFRTYGYYDSCLEVSESEHENGTYGSLDGDFLDPDQFGNGTEEEGAEQPVDPEEERFWRVVNCFQVKFSLRKTGLVDEATREMMELLAGELSEDYPRRRKRYATMGKWDIPSVTYYIENYNVDRNKTTMTNQTIRSEIQIAIKMWTDVINLKVTEFNSTWADIVIGFYPYRHLEGTFRNKIAHAFGPEDDSWSGDIHIKADESYSAFSFQGINLRCVVCHEFGHALGLGHSDAAGSIMNPTLPNYNPNLTLSDDDIKGVQSLYNSFGGGRTIDKTSKNWSWSCNFERADKTTDWCGMRQATDDSFDWIILYGPTSSDATGPDQAFRGKWYIYIEASNPHQLNDTAKIYIPPPSLPGNYCLTFHYHMFGINIGELQVFRETTSEAEPETIWRKTKEQGNVWLFAQLTVNIDSHQKIGFIGIRGDGNAGDIGLDDLSLKPNECK